MRIFFFNHLINQYFILRFNLKFPSRYYLVFISLITIFIIFNYFNLSISLKFLNVFKDLFIIFIIFHDLIYL
jgi:hypothetical protein